MLVVGVNLGSTWFGKRLRDGGSCVASSKGILIALSEERVAKEKSAGGFDKSFEICHSALGLNPKDIDLVVYSSCCELVRQRIELSNLELYSGRTRPIPSHHLSHALSAFLVSPFEEAIIIVIDSGGNILNANGQEESEWWKCSREQHSYYIGRGTECHLIDRDFFDPFEAGVGELYRAFTKFLGWKSSVYSGKTMALSTYGSGDRFKGVDLFYFDGDRLKSKITNNPLQPFEMIQNFAFNNNFCFGKNRNSNEPIEDIHIDIAHYIQKQAELAIIQKVRLLYRKTRIKNLCIAGGVGLNCIINTKLLEQTEIENIFIQPAAGDQGQCLGNALYGLFNILNLKERFPMNTAYLGLSYSVSKKEVEMKIQKHGKSLKIIETDDILETVAQLISQGKLVGWFQGKSEFGPRALGNRSILADPRFIESKNKLNKLVKDREFFLPFAPSILEECAEQYFDFNYSSPFMLFAPNVKFHRIREIPAVIHCDGTCRLQTVSIRDNPAFYSLIKKFYEKTGVPILLNTSLNPKDSPICETVDDALNFIANSELDYLTIGDVLVKNNSKIEDASFPD
jgi:carbamoyltransferase